MERFSKEREASWRVSSRKEALHRDNAFVRRVFRGECQRRKISLTRQQEFPDPVEGQPGSVHEQWCETDVAIPSDVSINSTSTVYWVLQWPRVPRNTSFGGKDEYYITCSDIDILADLLRQIRCRSKIRRNPQFKITRIVRHIY